MKKILTITILLLLTSTNVLAYTVYGAGEKTCGWWVESRNNSKGDFFPAIHWMLGYITAYGYYGSEKIRDFDVDAIMIFMDNYCRENPLEKIETGTKSLINALKQDNQ